MNGDTPTDFDVAVVGYGPVGQMAAILLGRLGHRVGVFERWPAPYPLPRAVHFDDEIARIFQRAGLAERLASITEPASSYEWQNAEGQTLMLLDRSRPGPSGWPAATMFSQPELEGQLDRAVRELPGVEVSRGWEAVELHDSGDRVELTVREGAVDEAGWRPTAGRRTVTAGFVIGCDGANSFVRESLGIENHDLGFDFDWLIADTIPRDPELLAGVNLQICDPARPTTMVSGGPGRRRWEWMLLPGETREEAEREDFAWTMLARSDVTPEQVQIERHAVYGFRARWAQRWRLGRVALAGDAAHLMPPFAGQGMCSGIRDAFTLVWHLDLVLRGVAAEHTLDEYGSERLGHLQHAIATSVELGKVICIADQAAAAARDEALLALAADPLTPAPAPPEPRLGTGLWDAGDPAAGLLFPQAEVAIDGQRRLLEDVIDPGFLLYVLDPEQPDPSVEESLRELGVRRVPVTGEMDVTGVYRTWFQDAGCSMALVRPDFYVFGTAAAGDGLMRLVTLLRSALAGEANPNQERPVT